MALEPRVVVLVGGVGGAKLALGLARILPPEHLTIVVNTADDLWYYGLRVCPDVDTVLYTLADRVDPVNGWGVAGDTTHALEVLRAYGEDAWFRLGDKDIATHMLRTHMLRSGARLTTIIDLLAQRMGIAARILPMADTPVATIIATVEHGDLDFQTYFVRHRWQPTVRGLRYEGAQDATMTPEVAEAIAAADVLLIGPSNPWLSIAPILAIQGLRAALLARAVPRVAVTPIVGGAAIKGPAAKMMRELGYAVTPGTVAAFYGALLNGFVTDVRDEPIFLEGVKTTAFDTMMTTHAEKSALARRVLGWILEWRGDL